MNFSSTYTIESKAFPGVTVRLRRLGPVERADIELNLCRERAEHRAIALRHEEARQKLDGLLKASKKDDDGKPIEDDLGLDTVAAAMEAQALAIKVAAFERSKIDIAYIRAAVLEFGEITYDGTPATADLLCEMGPDELFSEVVGAIYGNGYLSGEDARNLSSPSTSGAPVDGKKKSSTAPDAKTENSSGNETALPGTQST